MTATQNRPKSIRAMTRPLRAPLLVAFAAALATGCVTAQRVSAAGDVHTLLVAIRDDDRPAFDAHVDRGALEAQFQAALVDRARRANAPDAVKGAGLLLSGPLSRAAGGLLLRPEVFRAVAEYYGYRVDTPIPNPLGLAAVLRTVGEGRVCATLRKNGPCLLTFADEAGTWRLVAFDAHEAVFGLKSR